ncbi:hypothetical protein WAI453_010189 [Rhynchosporium graminicola]
MPNQPDAMSLDLPPEVLKTYEFLLSNNTPGITFLFSSALSTALQIPAELLALVYVTSIASVFGEFRRFVAIKVFTSDGLGTKIEPTSLMSQLWSASILHTMFYVELQDALELTLHRQPAHETGLFLSTVQDGMHTMEDAGKLAKRKAAMKGIYVAYFSMAPIEHRVLNPRTAPPPLRTDLPPLYTGLTPLRTSRPPLFPTPPSQRLRRPPPPRRISVPDQVTPVVKSIEQFTFIALKVKLPDGKTIEIFTNSDKTVAVLKVAVTAVMGCRPKNIKLVFQDVVLNAGQRVLSSFGISGNDTIHAVRISSYEPTRSMQIFIKSWNGKTLTITTGCASAVKSLKKSIYEKEGIPAEYQCLTYSGKFLNQDTSVLGQYGIGRESTLFLTVMVSLRRFTTELREQAWTQGRLKIARDASMP